MIKSSTQDSIKLEVSDFGPIINAKVDLRPLTIFFGASNTGKSYLAILLYALHQSFNRASNYQPAGLASLRFGFEKSHNETVNIILEFIKRALDDIQQALDEVGNSSDEITITIHNSILNLLRHRFKLGLEIFDSEIKRCFGIDDAHSLVRQESKTKAQISLHWRGLGDSKLSDDLTYESSNGLEINVDIPSEIQVQLNTKELKKFHRNTCYVIEKGLPSSSSKDGGDEFFLNLYLDSLNDLVFPHIFAPLHQNAFYLPADRTGIMHAHSVVVRALIGYAPMAGLQPDAHVPMLSGVLADFLQQLIEMDSSSHQRRRAKNNLDAQIEKTILGRSVQVERSRVASYPRFTYQPKGWKSTLPLMNASSMVSELAPVVLYLRHAVAPGNILIIEEPESHLHPAMQVEFTRQLAALINSGVRIIITTHSEWVLDELANIVHRSKLTETDRKKFSGSVVLNADQVGAWLFQQKYGSKGSFVEEIGLDESGLYPTSFDAVAATLHNDWAKISSYIEEPE